eukprot:GHVS01051150.1.p1 GENE.GHVS01051150.1~~GHVS01051150.1.p1  ORF type:complete len:118 (+),score=7.21 GHVS01051150.1:350-703(+)
MQLSFSLGVPEVLDVCCFYSVVHGEVHGEVHLFVRQSFPYLVGFAASFIAKVSCCADIDTVSLSDRLQIHVAGRPDYPCRAAATVGASTAQRAPRSRLNRPFEVSLGFHVLAPERQG